MRSTPSPGRLLGGELLGEFLDGLSYAFSVPELLLFPVPVEFVELGVGDPVLLAELDLLVLAPVGVLQVLLLQPRHHVLLLHLPPLLGENEGRLALLVLLWASLLLLLGLFLLFRRHRAGNANYLLHRRLSRCLGGVEVRRHERNVIFFQLEVWFCESLEIGIVKIMPEHVVKLILVVVHRSLLYWCGKVLSIHRGEILNWELGNGKAEHGEVNAFAKN